MNTITPQGQHVQMVAIDPRHYGSFVITDRLPKSDLIGNFSSMLENALQTVNDKQVQADRLVVQAAIAPDTVDVHDVSNALAQADMALSFTKAVVDRAVRAYQDITSAQ